MLAIQERRKRVAAAYLRGLPQHVIAANEGVAQPQISNDLKIVREQWRASAVMDFNTRQAQELAKIDQIEATAWEAWERSCKDAETLHVRTESAGETAKTVQEKTVRGQAGDSRFLERIGWCVEQRCKILGLNAAQKHEHSGSLDLDERRTRLLAIIASLRERAAGDAGTRGVGSGFPGEQN